MRVLVTGGAGFIGSTVCRRLISNGESVINVDKLTYAANPKSLATIAQDPSGPFQFPEKLIPMVVLNAAGRSALRGTA